ncbi:hypothetical protein BGZ97_005502 [Linnemannia gamsii]|uniref:Uncharacterized protein n=1 Tax=Linnemannia gamsii TaxID=64522 RepID=A0A9P6QUD7_9FUNG|nr:hypothetical protein BGZ97_005502 [Linnemannia gamsii]
MSAYFPSLNQYPTFETAMQMDAPFHHAVPAFPAPFSDSNEDSLWPFEENELNEVEVYQDLGGAQTVPVGNTKLKKSTRNISVKSGKKVASFSYLDPSKVYSGSVRMRSILFARNIPQLADMKCSDHALVEIFDVLPVHGVTKAVNPESATPETPLPGVFKSSVLCCRLCDIDRSLDPDAFEIGGIMRLVGVLLPCPENGSYSSESQSKLLCVATSDEINHTLSGGCRGLRPKQA